MTQNEQKILMKLKKDHSIIVLPADKGRTTVVMDREEYTNKASELLQDNCTYKKLDKNPTKTTISRINKKLKSLKDQQKLDTKSLP
jgi:hypothetical protein